MRRIKKNHNSLYYVSDSQKNSLPDLAHGFSDTLSKLGTNRQNSYLFLGPTSVFYVFAKFGGGGQKMIFPILHNTCIMQGSETILNIT